MEQITSVGHAMILTLGKWFAEKYVKDGKANVMWRCSKSARAKESGEDFIRAFNATLNPTVEILVSFTFSASQYLTFLVV
jgi:hypothetical protein